MPDPLPIGLGCSILRFRQDPMNKIYRDLFLSQARAAVAAARSVADVPHQGLKGQLREIVVRELLRPLLPPEFILATGQIVSADGDISSQVDIAACDRRLVPPLLFEGSCGILPLEATLFTVEVKSTLNSTELRKADAAARALAKFRYAPPLGSVSWNPAHKIEGIVSYVIAFGTDLGVNGKSEPDRYLELLDGDTPAIGGLCVVGRGFWFRTNSGWHEWSIGEPEGEVALFAAAILNTCQRIAGTRRQPDIRRYLMQRFDQRGAS